MTGIPADGVVCLRNQPHKAAREHEYQAKLGFVRAQRPLGGTLFEMRCEADHPQFAPDCHGDARISEPPLARPLTRCSNINLSRVQQRAPKLERCLRSSGGPRRPSVP